MGELCDSIEVDAHREQCFAGVGRALLVVIDYDEGRVDAFCDTMPSAEGITLCRDEALKFAK
jgi:hypothetical protein